MKQIVFVGLCLTMAGCASSSVMDIASDTIQVSTSAAPVCGQSGAQAVASKRAAIETLKRGYDSYMILDGDYQNNVRVVGTTPVIANTQTTGMINSYGNQATYSGQSNTYFSGGQPIIGGRHQQAITIRMFRLGDPGSERAIDAKRTLGPEWQEALEASNSGTCY
jgi:hypothetical protein